MKIPGPDHPIPVAAAPERERARIHDHVVADSGEAVVLQEAAYAPVVYFPREDVEMGFFSLSATTSVCPYKGRASYYTLTIDGEVIEDAAWSYETPYPHMEAIRGRLAFYPNKLEVYAVDAAALKHHERG